MEKTYSLYDQAIEITTDYLGPAAKRFIDRQIVAHLDKKPENLTPADLSKLTIWMEATVSLLTNDKDVVSEYINKLEELSSTSRQEYY
ncbi:MAG TPA: hypothetical protein VD947_04185 [Patescibacteria group bacterium]|nr:hypothetical protein [Patescibacteria group bacterium]